jgi:hypothetical protein
VIELLAKLADALPGDGQLIAIVECGSEHRRLRVTALSRAKGSDAVGIGTPLAGPAAFARDRHAVHCNGTRRNVHQSGASM